MAQNFYVFKIRVATKHHSLTVFFTVNGLSVLVQDRLSFSIKELISFVSEVKVQFSVGTKRKGVHSVVVLLSFDSLKNDFFFVGFVVAVFVGKQPNIRALRNQNAISHDQNPQRSIHFRTLVKHFAGICFSISVGIFQNQNAVAFGVRRISRNVRTIIVGFQHPHAAFVVNVDIGWVGNHGLGSKQIRLQTFRHFQCPYGVL